MDYKYDVFVSYQRKRFGFWVREHFVKYLDIYLEDALGKRPAIFIDEKIETGDIWPKRLFEALAYSKCLVCVWSPSYFESEWCKYECLTMLDRASNTGTYKRLVLPVTISDGENFPEWAKSLQSPDFRDYMFNGKGFEKSPDYFKMQKEIRKYAFEVKNAVYQAPSWSSTWLKKQEFEIPIYPQPKFSPPFME